MALGVLSVAYGFSRGRSSEPFAQTFYWLGLITVLISPTLLLVGRRTVSYREGLGVSTAIAIATYAIKECYSPIQFTFSDEFQHLPTINSILSTHHLFHANPLLPASPYYPALEILTSAVVLSSHLSIQASSVVVLFTVHTLGTIALYYLCLEISRNVKLSALAVVIYASGGGYLFFDSYFSYQSVGLPLATIAILCFVRMTRANRSMEAIFWTVATVVFGIVTVVAHHVSSYMMVVLLICLIISEVFRPSRVYSRIDVGLTVISIATITIFWDLVIAKPTFSYLVSTFSQLINPNSSGAQVNSALIALPNPDPLALHQVGSGMPFSDTLLEYAWVLLVSLSLIMGLVAVWRQRRRTTPQMIAWAIASLSVFVSIAIRAISPVGGGELASRMLSFSLIPGSLLCAIGISSITRYWLHSRSKVSRLGLVGRLRWSVIILFVAILEPGGIASGWPPFYARIPGPYVVAGRNRTVNTYDLNAAEWARTYLPGNSLIASDFTNDQLMDAIANTRSSDSTTVSAFFISRKIDPSLKRAVESLQLDFLVVDRQITSGTAVDGLPIFADDPFAGYYKAPIPVASLDKFDTLPGISRIYAAGPIVIYDLRRSSYGD